MHLLPNSYLKGAILALAISVGLPAQAADEGTVLAASASEAAAAPKAVVEPGEPDANRTTREGVVVEFSVRPTDGEGDKVMAADWADVTFRITDEGTGEPIKGRYPAAWMDLAESLEAKGGRPMTCRDRIATYLQGIVGVRPMIDLNSHFLLVMNRDASISVIDPAVGITGITNLFAQINLDRPGADWAKSADDKQLFVTMPLANKVAVVDTEAFKVVAEVDAGEQPTRAALQRDGRYLWVGNRARKAEQSGVSVIDAVELKPAAFIPTGLGHHEIAFSDDDRYAFVSNRDGGTVTVIDVEKLEKVKDIETGPVPISLAFSPLRKALYVADAKAGTITVVDPVSLEVRTRIEAKPGLGPLRFSQDGRWGMAVNPVENSVVVIDAATDTLAHTIAVGNQPYQLNFTRLYAYVRSLASEQVGLIPLSDLDEPEVPPVKYFPAGNGAPGRAAEISIAESIVPSVKDAAAAYVVNQAEGTVYYYMEGMTAPMGSFRNYGHDARAIEIVDRSLSEGPPGVYTGRVKIPVEGIYNVAFIMDTPRFVHCFDAEVAPNPAEQQAKGKIGIEYQVSDRRATVGESAKVTFKLSDPVSGEAKADLPDVTVLYYPVAGGAREVVPAKNLGEGLYQADVTLKLASTYYLFVGSRSASLKYNDLPFFSLMGTPAPVKAGAQAQAETQTKTVPEATR